MVPIGKVSKGQPRSQRDPFADLVAMTVPEAIEPVIKTAAGGVKEKTRNKWFRNVRKQPPAL